MPDSGNSYPLSFFPVSLFRGLSVLLIFSKKKLLVLWVFFTVFVLLISVVSGLFPPSVCFVFTLLGA